MDKERIVLEDLAMRLPYGVKCLVLDWDDEKEEEIEVASRLYEINSDGYCRFVDIDYQYNVDSVTPLLRYVENLSDEELRDAAETCLGGKVYKDDKGKYHSIHFHPTYGETEEDFDLDYFRNGFYGPKNVKWLLQHHVDFNDMINDGYARLVVEEDSPYKKED